MSTQLAAKLRAARQSAQLTQAQIAEAVGVTRGAVTQWESKDPETRTTPSIELIRKFAERAGVPFTWLINDQLKVEDVHYVRAQLRAGKWHEAEVTETVTASEVAQARVSQNVAAFQNNPVISPSTEEPPPPPRRAMLFWRAVEFEVCSTRPELEMYFEVPLRKGVLQATADFYTGDVVAELSTMHHQFLNPFIRRKLGELLLIEQIAGKPLKKYLLLWMPLGELPSVDITAMGASIGIDVLIYSQPHDAAQFLLQLA